MRKKIRKFASGGDILTAVGLGLVGKAVYDRIKGDKDKDKDKDSDFSNLKAVEPRGGGAMTEQQKIDRQRGANPWAAKEDAKEEPKKETPEEYLEKRGAKRPVETDTRTNPYYKEDEDKPEPAPKPAKKVTPDTSKPAASKPAASKPAPAPAPSEPKYKPYPKGVKGTHKDPFLTESYMSASEKQKKIQNEDKEKAKKAEEAKKKNKERKELVERETPSYKRGGSVNSASRRGDGIAQRGKTRGRVL